MAYWMLAAAAVSVISSLAGSKSAAKTAKRNAAQAAEAAKFNAENTLVSGLFNANMIAAASKANNSVVAAAARLGAKSTWDIAKYNADIRMVVGDYNADILEKEAFNIWESAKVDINNIENDVARTKGNILASYGASGAQINSTDSVADALIDAQTTAEMNKLVVRHGADIQATKVRNEAARSRWDGYIAAGQILYEGTMNATNRLANATLEIAGNSAQANINAAITYDNAWRNSQNILFGGAAQSNAYNAQASQVMADGLFTAAGKGVSAYLDYKASTYAANSGGGGKATSVSYNENLSSIYSN